MKQRSRGPSRKKGPLTQTRKNPGCPHVRLSSKKNQSKFIQEHPHYHFFIGTDGIIYFEKEYKR